LTHAIPVATVLASGGSVSATACMHACGSAACHSWARAVSSWQAHQDAGQPVVVLTHCTCIISNPSYPRQPSASAHGRQTAPVTLCCDSRRRPRGTTRRSAANTAATPALKVASSRLAAVGALMLWLGWKQRKQRNPRHQAHDAASPTAATPAARSEQGAAALPGGCRGGARTRQGRTSCAGAACCGCCMLQGQP
jgi:hypothetical protein